MKVFVLITCSDVYDASAVEIYGIYIDREKANAELLLYNETHKYDYDNMTLEEHELIE